MTNQSVPDKQSDNNIWELPEYSLHYDSSSEYDSNNSSIIDMTEVIPVSPMPGFDPLWEIESDFNEVPITYNNEEISASPYSDMEADYPSTDSELLSVEDKQPRTESIEINPDDYDDTSFDDAFHDLQHPQDVEWPNDAYREFMEIVNRYQFSNSAGDAVIKFFNKYSNLDVSSLPSTTKSEKEFLDNSTIPHMMLKEIPISTYQGEQEESSLSIGQRLLSIILCLMILLTPIANKPELHFVILTMWIMLNIKDDLNNISLTSVSPRTPNNMKQAIENGEAQDYSIHPEPNAFWGIR
ncbi:hypothetical protein C2G38_2192823 [Gigaspora rosea]|uniref:Uncharacterized protein n=1 Tax=Gigaspora rosea TaxID=44941 RepID=A0A397UYG6_9GLOM|nr:hypothetical protein C2G38_2192823 [Gigaspora rosea]